MKKLAIFLFSLIFFSSCKKEENDFSRYYHYYLIKYTNTNVMVSRNNETASIYCPPNWQSGDTCGTAGYSNWKIQFELSPNSEIISEDTLLLKEDVRVEIYFEDMTLLKNFRLDSGDITLKENLKYIEITN